MISYSIFLLFILFPLNINSLVNYKTACELLKLPRDCHCQRTRGVPLSSLNETRLRCRQFTKLTTDYRWSIVPYDRLAFETFNDNLTIHRFAFADIRARTIRFNVEHLYLNDHAFDNAYIGQLAISYTENYGKINFESDGQIFYGTTITNIFIKSIDFQKPISEIIFSNAKIYIFIVQSSKFYGFTNKKFVYNQPNETSINNDNQYYNFLEYDLMLTTSPSYQATNQSFPLKIRRKKKKKISPRQLYESSDENPYHLPDQTVTINITSINLPAFITIYTIISSINTRNLTEHYFPNNLEYSQTDEIELTDNYIRSIDAYAFRHLQFFEGRLLLKNNHIEYISPNAFSNLYLLNNLSLANNYIENLSSEHFKNLQQLYELDLSSNLIKELKNNIFTSLNNLHILRLNNNPLKYIDSNVFTNLTYLKEIYLQNVNLSHLIDPFYSQWIWNLASLHVNYLLNTNFDLSDVAFCLLSRFNQTLFHLPRQQSCSCNAHYLYHNPDLSQNSPSQSLMKYPTNYLRLTPICLPNETDSILNAQNLNRTDFILQGLEDKCDYKLMFIDCDAMTTTTTTTTTTKTTTITTELTTTIEITTTDEISTTTITTESSTTTTTPRYFKYTKPPKKGNNAKKLFTVLGILVAITLGAIMLVILWYRLKAMFKRKKTKKRILQQQKTTNSPSPNNNNSNDNNNHTTAPRYASSDMLSSIPGSHLMGHKSQSQALIASQAPLATIYKNADALADDPIHNIDDDNQQQQKQENITTDTQAVTQC